MLERLSAKPETRSLGCQLEENRPVNKKSWFTIKWIQLFVDVTSSSSHSLNEPTILSRREDRSRSSGLLQQVAQPCPLSLVDRVDLFNVLVDGVKSGWLLFRCGCHLCVTVSDVNDTVWNTTQYVYRFIRCWYALKCNHFTCTHCRYRIFASLCSWLIISESLPLNLLCGL